jgi:SHS2 domain-containing protein
MRRFVEHTAELELELESDSAEGALSEALLAFAELVRPEDGESGTATAGDPVVHRVDFEARDLPSLLASWLEELVFLSDAEGLIPENADLRLDGLRLTGVVRGHLGEPRPVVKAVTLHRLRFGSRDGTWRGRVVLDV